MEYQYRVHGLQIRTNQPIHGLLRLPPASVCDVEVRLESQSVRTDRDLPERWVLDAGLDSPLLDDPHDVSQLGLNGNHLQVRFDDGTIFLICCKGTRVYGSWPPELTLEDTLTYFLSTIFRLVLRLRGIVCLHASAVTIDGRAVALVGPAEAGKSTTAAAFARMGFSILSDDLVTLWRHGGSYLVQPSYRYLRLWPDAAEMLLGPEHGLPLLTPTWEKRYLELGTNGSPFEERALPLSALYFLMPRSADGTAPNVRPAAGAARFLTLVSESYSDYLVDPEARVQEFRLMADVLRSLPSREATPHCDPARLPKLCELIVDDFRALQQEAGHCAA